MSFLAVLPSFCPPRKFFLNINLKFKQKFTTKRQKQKIFIKKTCQKRTKNGISLNFSNNFRMQVKKNSSRDVKRHIHDESHTRKRMHEQRIKFS